MILDTLRDLVFGEALPDSGQTARVNLFMFSWGFKAFWLDRGSSVVSEFGRSRG